MKNLQRLFLKKIPSDIRKKLMGATAHFIFSTVATEKVIFFGSIITDNCDECSDIDAIAIYKTPSEADKARRKIYNSKRPDLGHSLEIICVDEATFNFKSKVGGVYAIAQDEGQVFMPSDIC